MDLQQYTWLEEKHWPQFMILLQVWSHNQVSILLPHSEYFFDTLTRWLCWGFKKDMVFWAASDDNHEISRQRWMMAPPQVRKQKSFLQGVFREKEEMVTTCHTLQQKIARLEADRSGFFTPLIKRGQWPHRSAFKVPWYWWGRTALEVASSLDYTYSSKCPFLQNFGTVTFTAPHPYSHNHEP